MSYYNQYKYGYVLANHKDKVVATSVNSTNFEQFLANLKNLSYDEGTIPGGYEHRPDLISDLFYNTPTLDWLIMYFNDISDPFNQLNAGDRILIPKF
jgi:hypothetical protein